jgi:hypothetical protein
MNKKIMALIFALAVGLPNVPVFVSEALACSNSYDRASDGSACGGRASGCKSGGRGGYC